MGTRVAVIIVTYNSLRYLKNLCASLDLYIDTSKDNIFFVDNGSTDGTIEYLDGRYDGYPGVRILQNSENTGFGRANNKVMLEVTAKYYLLLNPDTYLTSDIISEILSNYPCESEIGIVGAHLVFPDGSYQTSAYPFSSPLKWMLQDIGVKRMVDVLCRLRTGRYFLKPLQMVPMFKPYVKGFLFDNTGHSTRESVDWICGACMFLSRKVFEATGGFDENIFMYGEDEELCYRAKRLGFKVERVKAGPVVHYYGWDKNIRDNILTSERYYESLLHVINKNYNGFPFKKWFMQQIIRRRYRKIRKI